MLCQLFDSCDKLMLDRFIDCLETDEYSRLIVNDGDFATPERLEATWEKIYMQFAELSADGTYNEVYEVSKEIDDLRCKIYLTDGCIYHLRLEYSKPLVDILNGLSLMCTITEDDQGPGLESKLQAITGRAKKWLMKLREKRKELAAMQEKNTGKMNRKYFDDSLDELTKFLGCPLIIDTQITVTRFLRLKNKMIAEYKRRELEEKLKKVKR